MDITRENTGELNAVLHVTIKQNDYEERVNKILKDYKKKASMPGFRPGMVPFGMIKKMYGKAIVAEEVNKLLSENLYKYINDEKLEILGNPLPAEDHKKVNFDTDTEFEFSFDLGLAPIFDVALSGKDKFTRYVIAVEDKMIDEAIDNVSRRYGKVEDVEISDADDMLQGEFVEKDKENGIKHTSTISLKEIEDDKIKKQLIGAKVGDTITLDPKKVSKGPADTAAMLGIKKEDLGNIENSLFDFTVAKIYRVKRAEINQDIFDKIFGKDTITTIEQFREKIKEDIQEELNRDSNLKLEKDIVDAFKEKLKLSLPDSFLKRWLLQVNENKYTAEDIEREYDEFSDYQKWQLISGKIIKQFDIKVSQEEAYNEAKRYVSHQFMQYGVPFSNEDSFFTEYVNKILEKESEARRIYNVLYDRKVLGAIKENVTIKDKEVSQDEFNKILEGKTSKFNLFNKLKF